MDNFRWQLVSQVADANSCWQSGCSGGRFLAIPIFKKSARRI